MSKPGVHCCHFSSSRQRLAHVRLCAMAKAEGSSKRNGRSQLLPNAQSLWRHNPGSNLYHTRTEPMGLPMGRSARHAAVSRAVLPIVQRRTSIGHCRTIQFFGSLYPPSIRSVSSTSRSGGTKVDPRYQPQEPSRGLSALFRSKRRRRSWPRLWRNGSQTPAVHVVRKSYQRLRTDRHHGVVCQCIRITREAMEDMDNLDSW